MRRYLLSAATSLALVLPAAAQEAGDDGFSLMEKGAQLFFEGIMREMEPALKDLEGLAEDMEPGLRLFVEEMGPALAELLNQIDDFSAYHPPEMLPNGDIIIRRKTPLEIEQDENDGEIEI